MKPFRFGVQVSQVGSASQWRDKARKLEDLGFSTLFMPDHFGPELAPLPAIAMAAAHTTSLRVGSLVFDNDYKHPAILAKEAATIDLLSDGRLELGVGAGSTRRRIRCASRPTARCNGSATPPAPGLPTSRSRCDSSSHA